MDSFGTIFNIARGCAILANIVIGSCMIFLICLNCAMVRKTALRVVGMMLVLGGILEGLTFLIFLSATLCESCEIFFGSGLAILCSFVTILNGIVVCRIPEVVGVGEDDLKYDTEEPPPTGGVSSDDDDDEGVRSEYTGYHPNDKIQILQHNINGRRQIVTTYVHQDGSPAGEDSSTIEEDLIGENLF
jgi:hypothetical protein